MRNAFFFCLFLLCSACRNPSPFELKLPDLQGAVSSISAWKNNEKGTVLIFLSPECPLCISYAGELGRLEKEFNDSLLFVGVFSGDFYSREEINKYLKTQNLKFKVLLDKDTQLAKRTGAKVTPEVIVFDSADHQIYKGAIDNKVVSLRQRRTKATAFYLQDALQALLQNREPKVKETLAVGCFIE